MRFLRRGLAGIFLLSLTLALLALAGRTVFDAVQTRMADAPPAIPQRARAQAVNVVDYVARTETPQLVVFGELRSLRTLELRATVGGTVIEVSPDFVEGGAVEAGELLVRIDPAEAEAALARARTALEDAGAELRDAERGLALARDDLAAAQEQASLRARALARQQDLSGRGVGTEAAVETAELAASSAQATVLSRRRALAEAEARIDKARTRLRRSRIDVQEAERTRADTDIRAAFDGVLADVAVVEGGRVAPNERLAQLVDPGRLEAAFRLSTSDYARLLDDSGALMPAPVVAQLDGGGVALTATGRISRESAEVGEGRTGRRVFAVLDDARGFRPGDFVTIRIAEPPLDGVARLPATAVAADGTVLVLGEGDRLETARVDVLRRQGDDVLVRAPDLDGRTLVAQRSPLLGEGIEVRPVRREGDAAALLPLDADRRARLVAFVEASAMDAAEKGRLLSELSREAVPAATVARLEARMGS